MRRRLLCIYGCLLLGLIACKDDDGIEAVSIPSEQRQLFVLNEGNFQFGNASLSIYDIANKERTNFLFQANNSGRPIGDVVQSMKIIEDKGYIVVNNSAKIEVVDMQNFKSLGAIAPLNSPRYILPLSIQKAYVSDLYEGKISVIDLQDLSITGAIHTGGWTEAMELVGDKAFVCHMDSAQLLVINTLTNQIIDRISTPIEPQHIRKDINDNLWISCSGGFNEGISALVQINPDNHRILKKLEASSLDQSIGELELNAAGDQLYYLDVGGLFRISIEDNALSEEALIKEDGRLFYGLGLDPVTDEIYISDAIDFQQNGVIFRFDKNGSEIDFFRSGIIPGDFVFYN